MTSQHLADRLLAAHQFARKANLKNEEYERALDEADPKQAPTFVQVGDHDPELRRAH